MPDIDSLLEKESKKKFKKSSYRPWNYLDEIEKEEGEKKEDLSSSQALATVNQINQNQPEKIEALRPIEISVPVPVPDTGEQDTSKAIPQTNNLPNINEVKKEQTQSPLYSILRLTGHQKVIFSFVLEKCLSRGLLSSGIVTSKTLVTITNTTLSMVNTSIQRLVDKDLIFRENGKRGRGGFYCFGINESVKDAATEYKRLSAFDNLDGANKKAEENHIDGYDLSKSIDNRGHSYDIGMPKELENIDVDLLHDIGFSKGHLVQLFKQEKLDLSTIQDSINHYAYDLRYNNKVAEIKKTSPIGYFMGILMRVGLYNPPENYESPKDRALRMLLERKKSEKEKRDGMIKELTTIAFDDWQEKLTKEEKDELLPEDVRRSRLSAAKTASLKTYFTENVWPNIAPKEIDL
jgi:hypothetical protein